MGRRALVVLVVVAGVLLAACTGDADDEGQEPPLSGQLQELEPAQPADLGPEQPANARDSASVMAALWATDPCALMPRGIASERVVRESPHACLAEGQGRDVGVYVGSFFGDSEKVKHHPVTIAGRRAYEAADDGVTCYIWIPVSPNEAIFVADEREAFSCNRSKRIAAHAIRRIRAGATGSTPAEGFRPPCQTLRTALGNRSERHRLVYGTDSSSIDSCSAVSVMSPKPDSPSDPPAYAKLELSARSSIHGGPSMRIRGHGVGRRLFPWEPTSQRRCEMEWTEQGEVISVMAGSCPRTRQIVERVMGEYDRRTPTQTSAPRLRLYEPNESDRGMVGACNGYVSVSLVRADGDPPLMPDGPGCRTYEEPELPSEAAKILRDAQADPRVTCKLAREAVNDHVPDVEPVVLTDVPAEIANPFGIRTRPCAFVGDVDERQYLVVASAKPLPAKLIQAGVSPLDGDQDADLFFQHDIDDNADFGGAAERFGRTRSEPGFVAVMVSSERGFGHDAVSTLPTTEESETAATILESIIDEHFKEAP